MRRSATVGSAAGSRRGKASGRAACLLLTAALAACGSGGDSSRLDGGGSGGGGSGGGGSGGGGSGGGGDPGGGAPQLAGDIGPRDPAADPPVPAGARYASPDGDDAGAGTEQDPWRTLARAAQALAPGETLVLRGGVYLERDVPLSLAGTAVAPITIRNHPGEQPIVDGGFAEFRTAPNTDWQPFDPSRAVYRSTRSYATGGQVYGYLGPADGGHRLVPYESLAALMADREDYSDTIPYYCGPGVCWNAADQRIYVRLQRSRDQVRFGLQGVPADTDPRNTPLLLAPDRKVLALGNATRHLVLHGLSLRGGERIADVPGQSQGVTLRNCTLQIGRYGLVVRDGTRDLTLEHVHFRGAFPPWVARSDVKAAQKPAHLMQDAALEFSGDVQRVEIGDCRFTGLFDGIDSSGAPAFFAIHHCEFTDIRDDALEIATAGHHFEFHHNVVRRAAAAVSWNGASPPPAAHRGTKYVHHNVIDTSTEHLYGRDDPLGQSPVKWLGPDGDGLGTGPAFGTHETSGFGGPDPWRIYQNTFVGGADVDNDGLGIAYRFAPFDQAVPHAVFNNVMVQTEDQFLVRRARVADGSQAFDGNVYHRTVPHPGTSLLDSHTDGSATRSFATLVSLQTSALWLNSRAAYAPGWEALGLEGDPGLDDGYAPAPDGPAAQPGVDLRATGWPGAGDGAFRGAVPPR